VTGNTANRRHVADILLEAVASMQRGVDLMREAAQVIRQSDFHDTLPDEQTIAIGELIQEATAQLDRANRS
jgi:hypothetical protein